MNIEQRINQLFKRLVFLGYYPFQVKNIIQEAIGTKEIAEINNDQYLEIINALEKYEKLGNEYALAFSK